MSLIPIWVKALILAAIAAMAFGAGWHTKGQFDQVALDAEHAATQKAADSFHDQEQHVATILETRLATLNANKTVIQHEVQTIVDRSVYSNTCIDSDGLSKLRSAIRGQASASEPATEVSGATK